MSLGGEAVQLLPLRARFRVSGAAPVAPAGTTTRILYNRCNYVVGVDNVGLAVDQAREKHPGIRFLADVGPSMVLKGCWGDHQHAHVGVFCITWERNSVGHARHPYGCCGRRLGLPTGNRLVCCVQV